MKNHSNIAEARQVWVDKTEMTFQGRFWSRVKVRGINECWLWQGSLRTNGYGGMQQRRRFRPAHRVAYELCVGEIPEGAVIHHTCGEKLCVNPVHLEAMDEYDHKSMHDNLNVGRR